MIRMILTTAAMATSIVAFPASAQEIFTHIGVKDGYRFHELGFTACDQMVVQGGATATWENGIYVDYWISEGGDDSCDEQDFTVGATREFAGMTFHGQLAYFDIKTPEFWDFDADQDVIRVRLEVSDTIEMNESLSFGWFAGYDVLEGILETNAHRAGTSLNYSADTWTYSGTVGATHRTDTDTVSTYVELVASRPVGNWTISANANFFASPIESGETFGLSISRVF